MRKILIVEDNEVTRLDLIKTAHKIDNTIEVLSTGNAGEALEYARNNSITALFLDIQLLDYSGLELAKQIREIKAYHFTPIIFITAMPTRELEAFRQIHCYDYIIKPYTQEQLEHVFKSILINYVENMKKQNNDKLLLEFKNFSQFISIKDIMYIEYKNRKIIIHTKRESISYIHMPLIKFKEKLPAHFIQIHQAFIVNSKYVSTIELNNQLLKLMDQRIVIPIGRSYKKEVGDMLNGLH